MKTKKILLVQPFQTDGLVCFGQTMNVPGRGPQAAIAPLGPATVAALTPEGYEVAIWDETVDGEITEDNRWNSYDLIGVTGYEAHLGRARALGQMFKRQGIFVVAGGPGASASPEKWRDAFDVIFVGEAEYTWPQFLAEWEAGRHRSEYREIIKPDLAASPLPNWAPVDLNRYMVGALQTTRGCPYDCSFCDVIYLYGRRPRHKPVDRVLAEVAELERRRIRNVFVSDDNFYGNPKYAKALLRELIPLNNSFPMPIRFSTQITMNVANDDELLALMADANFTRLFIGVETPNKDSLKEVNKTQNYRKDMGESIRKIQSYGMAIRAGMIVGFDHDSPRIFDEQLDFIAETNIPLVMTSILQAPIGTPLWKKLYQEERILESQKFSGPGQRSSTNIIPVSMSRAELYQGLSYLQGRLFDWEHFAHRMIGFVSGVTRKPKVSRRLPISWSAFRVYFGFVSFFLFRLRGAARRHAWRILSHTIRKKPYLLEMVAGHVFQFHHERQFVEPLQAKLHQQVEWEKGQNLKVAKGNLLVPAAFKKSYKTVFPEVRERLSKGLQNGARVNDALVEVFGDFVVRWGPTFTEFEDYHRDFLLEICDRTIAKENASVAGDGSAPASSTTESLAAIRDLRIAELPDEILRIVEQDLRVAKREAAANRFREGAESLVVIHPR